MLTFVDSSVLIAAARGKGKQALLALTILSDPAREFASSRFVRLETLPKTIFHKQQAEAAFYESFFNEVAIWYEAYEELVEAAELVGGQFGLSMGDALHVAAAIGVEADELVTAERPSSPFKNVTSLKITSIYSA